MEHSRGIINQRIHLGGGRYFQRGICRGISEGDTISDCGQILNVVQVIEIRDAKANNWTEEECKDAFYEVILQQPDRNFDTLPCYTNSKADTSEILEKYSTPKN